MRPVPSSIASKLKAAAVPIAERGLDQTKIEELAHASGVPKATLYYYFTGKEEILAFLLRDLLTEVADAVAIACDGSGIARDRLISAVTAQLVVMAAHPAVWQALIADLGRAGRIPEIAQAIAEAFYTPVQRLLAEGASDGSLRRVEDPVATSMAIFGAVTISGLHYLVAGIPLDPEQVGKQVMSVVLDGLGTKSDG